MVKKILLGILFISVVSIFSIYAHEEWFLFFSRGSSQEELLYITNDWMSANRASEGLNVKAGIPVGKSRIACSTFLLEASQKDCNLIIIYPMVPLEKSYVSELEVVLSRPCSYKGGLGVKEFEKVQDKFKCNSKENYRFSFVILQKKVIHKLRSDGGVDNEFVQLAIGDKIKGGNNDLRGN